MCPRPSTYNPGMPSFATTVVTAWRSRYQGRREAGLSGQGSPSRELQRRPPPRSRRFMWRFGFHRRSSASPVSSHHAARFSVSSFSRANRGANAPVVSAKVGEIEVAKVHQRAERGERRDALRGPHGARTRALEIEVLQPEPSEPRATRAAARCTDAGGKPDLFCGAAGTMVDRSRSHDIAMRCDQPPVDLRAALTRPSAHPISSRGVLLSGSWWPV